MRKREMPKDSQEDEFFIIDVRESFERNPYITLWRPNNANYAYPLAWAGRYTRRQIEEVPGYYYKRRHGHKQKLDRYPVPCSIVEKYGIDPAKGLIDGDTGPVIPNTAEVRKALRRARMIPDWVEKEKDAA